MSGVGAISVAKYNLRDLGGLCARGGRIRCGRFYRSGATHRAGGWPSEADICLPDFGTVIDLRTDAEFSRAGRPQFCAPTTDLIRIPIGPPVTDVKKAPEVFMRERYLWTVLTCGSSLASLIRILGRAKVWPVAICCSAGQDRTGIAVALILTLLGVAAPDIVRDYARSAEATSKLVELPDGRCIPVPELSWRSLCHVQRSLAKRFGSAWGYAEWIGLQARDITALRDQLVEWG